MTSLDEYSTNSIRLPLWDKASAEFCFAKSRELLTKPFPAPHAPYNSCRDLHTNNGIDENYAHQIALEHHFQNLSVRSPPFYHHNNHMYRDRTLTKSENMSRKTYTNDFKYQRAERNRSFLDEIHPPPPSPFNVNRNGDCFTFHPNSYEANYTPDIPYNNIYVYDNNPFEINEKEDISSRPRALSFSDSQENVPKKSGKSIRDRNRRRQSYNPQAYAETSSSESDCTSLGSVDLDWRRRRRLSRLSASNSSIRSEMIMRNRSNCHYLKPEFPTGLKSLGRSPPPSNSILSGLSPTSVSRCQRQNESSSSDSSL